MRKSKKAKAKPKVVANDAVRVIIQKNERIRNAIRRVANEKKRKTPPNHTFHHTVKITPKTNGVRQLTIHWEYRPIPN